MSSYTYIGNQVANQTKRISDRANDAVTFANNAYTHANASYNHANTKFASAGGTISGDVNITGNLLVQGPVTSFQSGQVNFFDPILNINAGIDQLENSIVNAGLSVDRGFLANVSLIWNESIDKWIYTNDGTSFSAIASDAAETYANVAFESQNITGIYANAAFSFANTANDRAVISGTYANSAYNWANTKFSSTGGTVAGDVEITGNLKVSGAVSYIESNQVNIGDSILNLNADIDQLGNPTENAGISVDRGLLPNVAVLWNENSKVWQFTNDGTNYLNVASDQVNFYANGAFVTANIGGNYANSAYIQANSAYDSQNTTGNYSNSAYGHANGAYEHANAAFETANNLIAASTDFYARPVANSAYEHANGAYEHANSGHEKANDSYIHANAAFDFANSFPFVGVLVHYDSFTTDGVSDTFGLSTIPEGANSTIVNIDGITQLKSTYDIINNNIVFPEILPSGLNVEVQSIQVAAGGQTPGIYANTAYEKANIVGNYANSAYIQANAAFRTQNTTGSYANSAFDKANTTATSITIGQTYANGAFEKVNLVSSYANAGYEHANAAYEAVNSSPVVSGASYANSAFIVANSSYLLAANSLNVQTGGTISGDVTITGNLTVSGTETVVETETLKINDNIIDLNSNYTIGNPFENAGIRVIRGDLNDIQLRWNESVDAWQFTNDGGFYSNIASAAAETYSNSAYGHANSAYARANTSLNVSAGGTITGDITITGNLKVQGSRAEIDTEFVRIFDNIIDLNSDVTSGAPSQDAGIRVVRGDESSVQIRWNESLDKWQFTNDGGSYNNIASESIQTTIQLSYDTANVAGSYANAAFDAANSAVGASLDVWARDAANSASSYANGAFDAANNATSAGTDDWARDAANSASSYANGAFDAANNATDSWVRDAANSGSGYANSSYIQANASFGIANVANEKAAAAYGKANTVGSYANSAYEHANAAFEYANGISGGIESDTFARDSANSASSYANSAFGVANTVYNWGDHSAQTYATITYVDNSIASLVDTAPETLNTLNELAAALGDDANFATTVSSTIGVVASYANSAFDAANNATDSWVRDASNSASSYANSAFAVANNAAFSPEVVGSYANSSYTHSNAAFEYANTVIGGGNFIVSVFTDNFVGDGVTDTFSLSLTPANENYILVTIEGITQLKSSYSVSGSDLVFSEPPEDNDRIDVTIFSSFESSNIALALDFANSASSYANSSFDAANNKLSLSGGTLTGNLVVSGNIVPSDDNIHFIGSETNRWHSLYVGPGSVNIDGIVLSNNNGTLTVSNAENFELSSASFPSLNLISEKVQNAYDEANLKSQFTISSFPPGSARQGDRWFDSDLGQEFVYINDGDSSQWVELSSFVDQNYVEGIVYYKLENDYTGLNDTTSQPLLGVGVNLVANTIYEFESLLQLNKTVGSNNHTISLIFDGDLTINNILYTVLYSNTSLDTISTPKIVIINSLNEKQISENLDSNNHNIMIRGTISVNTSGSFTPKYKLSEIPGESFVTKEGSYFKLKIIDGTTGTTNINIGNWF